MKIKKFFETSALLLALFYIEFLLAEFIYGFIKEGFSWIGLFLLVILVISILIFLLMVLKPNYFTDYENTFYNQDAMTTSPTTRPIFSAAPSFMSERQSPGCAIFMGWLMLLIPLIIIIYNLIFD